MKHRTRSGDIMDVQDMSDQHLSNAIKCFERKAEEFAGVRWRKILPPIYYKMLEEAAQRKLLQDRHCDGCFSTNRQLFDRDIGSFCSQCLSDPEAMVDYHNRILVILSVMCFVLASWFTLR